MSEDTKVAIAQKRGWAIKAGHLRRINQKLPMFLSLISEGHSPSYSARQVGVHPTTPYRWRRAIPSFAAAWAEAYEFGGDTWEDFLYDQAKSGNVGAIAIGLKMRRRFIETQYIRVGYDDLRARLLELAPDMAEDEAELAIQEAMKLLPSGRR